MYQTDRSGRHPGSHLCSGRIHRSCRCLRGPNPRRGRRRRFVRSRPGLARVSLPAKAAAEGAKVPTTSKRSRLGRRNCRSEGRSQKSSPTDTGRCRSSDRSRGSSRSPDSQLGGGARPLQSDNPGNLLQQVANSLALESGCQSAEAIWWGCLKEMREFGCERSV